MRAVRSRQGALAGSRRARGARTEPGRQAGRQQLQLRTPRGSGGATTLARYSHVRIASDTQRALDTCEGEQEFGIPRHLCNFQPSGDSTEVKGQGRNYA